ncbi:MAG: hypothetical protein P8166_13390 [Candidatus Thiodiazotropha sp.]
MVGFSGLERDQQALDRLLERVESGKLFLVHGLGDHPFSPVVHWKSEGEGKEDGRWVVSPSETNLFVTSSIESLISQVSRPSRGGAAGSSLWDQVAGGAKELVNQLAAENNALKQEWFAESGIFSYKDKATGQTLTPEEVAERYRNDSPPCSKPKARTRKPARRPYAICPRPRPWSAPSASWAAAADPRCTTRRSFLTT